jgi:hypothetical protein
MKKNGFINKPYPELTLKLNTSLVQMAGPFVELIGKLSMEKESRHAAGSHS